MMQRGKNWRKRVKSYFAGLALLAFFSSLGFAAVEESDSASGQTAAGQSVPSPAEEPIDYTGDKISYDQKRKILSGEGHVVITHKNMILKADRVIGYLETSDVYADGRVVLSIGNQVFTGEKVHFNFKTRLGDFINGSGFVDPWYGKGKTIRKAGPNEYQITDGYITSCPYEEPHYRIKAKKIYIFPKERLIARDVIFSLGGMNLLWSPVFSRSLKDERQRFTFVPGYNSRFGPFLLSAYNFWMDPYLNGSVHGDFYAKRGLGTGVSCDYKVGAPATSHPMAGNFKSYVIDDANYSPTQATKKGSNPRYRVSLQHEQQIFPDTRLLSEIHAMSDPDIIDDFFRDEFEENVQPQTFVDLAKTTENYRLALFARKRLNKIFNVLERLPEIQFQTRTLPIANTGLYHSSTSSGGYYNQALLDKPDYDSVRLDTYQELSYPFKILRFLNLEPKAGYQETFYSKGVSRDNLFRGIFSTSVDVFVKLHKLYPDVHSSFWDVHQLRHVMEPRVTYTFVPKPSRPPSDLLQFDSIDSLDRQNFFRFGLRQLLQTRRHERTVNIVDTDVSIRMYPDPKLPTTDRFGKTHRLSDIFLESRYRPLDWVGIDVKSGYDTFNQEISQTLVDVAFIHGDQWNISLRQRYAAGQNNLFALEALYRFNEDWIAKGFWRYDFQFGKLEEQEYTLLRDLHCWEVALTYRQRQLRNDMSLFVVFRLKDYPDVPIKFGN